MAIPETGGRLKRRVDEFERRLILGALAASGWNQRTAARGLGVLPTTLNAKIKRLGIPSRPGAPVDVPEPLRLPEPDAREEFVWEGPLGAGRTLEIDGVTGAFRAEVAPTECVRLVATKHGPAALRRRIAITVISSRRGVLVRAKAAREERGEGVGALAVRVDVAVQVPTGVRLLVHRMDTPGSRRDHGDDRCPRGGPAARDLSTRHPLAPGLSHHLDGRSAVPPRDRGQATWALRRISPKLRQRPGPLGRLKM